MVDLTLLQSAPSVLVASILFVLLIWFYILGYRLRLRKIKKSSDPSIEDLGAINGTLLGLLALLLAFTFGVSNSRYDTRRNLIIEEANNIGTVILRTDFFHDSLRHVMRSHLRDYVEARIAFYEARMHLDKALVSFNEGSQISTALWLVVSDYGKKDPVLTHTSQLIPALNAMIDITTTRRAAGEATIPDSIMYFLFILCLTSAFLLGYDHKNKFDWVVVIGFALMLSITVFTIIDLDRPRSGLIDMDKPHQKIVELREMFKE